MAYILTVLPSNDVALELASFLDRTLEATTCVEKVKADLDAGKTAAAISHLVSESNKLWASTKATDKDIEAFYAQLTHFLITPENKTAADTRDAIVGVVSSDTNRATLRLAVLNNLFNAAQDAAWKIAVLTVIVKLAIEAKQNTILENVLQDLDRLFQLWNASAEDRANVHYLLHTLLAESDAWLSHVHLMKWLESFKTEADCEKEVEKLTKAVAAAVAKSDVFLYQSLVNSAAARVVAKSNPDLIKLATIYVNGSYKDLIDLTKTSKIFTTVPGLTQEAAVTKIRLLTLTALAQEKTNIPYQQIATALDVPLDDAESFVLDAISEGILDAKLDHLSSSIFVTYALRREFATAQWTDLHNKLGKWLDNIKGMLNVIRESRSHQGSTQQHLALKQGLVSATQ